ncbi:MAG TPA: thioesterase family protein, partial [Steroidobacteraceae bacterium]
DSRYLQVFGDATDALFRCVGVDDAYRLSGRALYTVESHVTHGVEAKALEPLYVLTRLLEVDEKRVHLFHALHRRRDDALVATGEQMYLHVDTNAGKAAPMDAAVRAKLEHISTTQAGLPRPAQQGRRVGMSRE